MDTRLRTNVERLTNGFLEEIIQLGGVSYTKESAENELKRRKEVELNVVNNVDDDIDFFDGEERNFQKIDIYHLSIGDYILVECEGSFGGSSYIRIEDMQTRYDEYNGKPYIAIFDEEGEIWSSKTGECLTNSNTFYSLTGYYRKI